MSGLHQAFGRDIILRLPCFELKVVPNAGMNLCFFVEVFDLYRGCLRWLSLCTLLFVISKLPKDDAKTGLWNEWSNVHSNNSPQVYNLCLLSERENNTDSEAQAHQNCSEEVKNECSTMKQQWICANCIFSVVSLIKLVDSKYPC
jgi:hypothetical protein